MGTITPKILDELLLQFEKEPQNLDLMNQIALGYFENYDKKTDRDDYKFFKKAYNLKKTVKSTHNFAWFLYFEFSEIEWRWNEDKAIQQALSIQEECINLKPKSFYPYYQYAYMLLHQEDFEKAIDYLKIAQEKAKNWNIKQTKRRDIEHNLGYCYFQIKNFEKAKTHFQNASQKEDIECRSLYNLAITNLALQNFEATKEILDILYKDISSSIMQTVSGYELGVLYYLIDEPEKAKNAIIKQGINHFHIFWEELNYILYQTDRKLWKDLINTEIDERLSLIKEVDNNNKDWQNLTSKEKQENRKDLQEEIKKLQGFLKNGLIKPNFMLNQYILVEFCGCLMFDCKRHENPKDDY